MRRCLSCDRLSSQSFSNLHCATCGVAPTFIDGFCAYAPDLAHSGGGFQPDYFAELARLETENFWFRARNQLIVWAIKAYCHDFHSFLEIGCGTGYVLSGVAKAFPEAMIYGSEIFTTGLGFAAERLPLANFMQMDGRNIPFLEEFDIIGAFDVLEHIQEDELVLSQVYSSLKPGSHVVLTVPQHPWLWSAIDEHAYHVRRYTAADIHRKLEAVGFEIVRSTSFVTTLLPAMMASRFLKRNKTTYALDTTEDDMASELKLSPWMNKLFFQFLQVELNLIKTGLNFPIGGSRLVVAKKPK